MFLDPDKLFFVIKGLFSLPGDLIFVTRNLMLSATGSENVKSGIE